MKKIPYLGPITQSQKRTIQKVFKDALMTISDEGATLEMREIDVSEYNCGDVLSDGMLEEFGFNFSLKNLNPDEPDKGIIGKFRLNQFIDLINKGYYVFYFDGLNLYVTYLHTHISHTGIKFSIERVKIATTNE